MDLGNYHPTSFTDPTGDHFDYPCWHIRAQFGSGNYRPCLKCNLVCEAITKFKCIHCAEFHIASEDYYIPNGDWVTFSDGSEGYNDDHVYRCSKCTKITANPEMQYTETWIKPTPPKK